MDRQADGKGCDLVCLGTWLAIIVCLVVFWWEVVARALQFISERAQ
jgi:hypothetical protein